MSKELHPLLKFSENVNYNQSAFKETTASLTIESVENIQKFQRTHTKYTQTPLRSLKELSAYLGVKNIFVKDESYRFGLNAFKVLGGLYAIGQYIAEQLGQALETLTFSELTSFETKEKLGELTFITATDGNHGKGVAWAARELGHRCVVYLPKGAAKERVEAIQQEGAQAKVIDGNYDEAVRLAAQKAKKEGWVVLQDTAWEGYEKIPNWVLQGYATLAQEIVTQLDQETTPTHLFLQVGVGSYAASVATYFTKYYSKKPPKIILVEPHAANCYYRSFKAKSTDYEIVEGDLDTIMAGLSCGEPNPKAWEILRTCAEGGISADDRLAALGMRLLGHPLGEDPRIIAGESGAAPAGVLYHLMKEESLQTLRETLEIDENSTVVLINTEGDTDEKHYKQVVWEGANSL